MVGLSISDANKWEAAYQHVQEVMNNPFVPTDQDSATSPMRRKHMRLEILPEDVAVIVQMYQSGMTTAQIGKQLGCCRQKIGDCLKRQGINIKSPYQGDPIWRKRIIDTYAEEHTFKGTARCVGVSVQTVKRVLIANESANNHKL
ncbi:MAG: hypothetical protein L0K77_04795 [Bifidobacterium crudilactis]|uniref:hypothetical protein n=1 Tax=Bifidobacterium crudilactis TaxID=327277 RepID=UPI002648E9E3|nr:hypothetical protein [Bifidobacterium crudilactis]MDN6467906.1 hypothetical protein [Bifidobacterium crudilactis]MDN6558654.1 hypothetical protein [Bifidobacterium crudilactis]MDN6586624.1 hypothetical protein [Bifidobacterium crudilactis]MDN6804196.1 hypothetical protein [Bifidobacterium crudilactis]